MTAPALLDDVVICFVKSERCLVARGPHESGYVYETRLRAEPRFEGEDGIGVGHRRTLIGHGGSLQAPFPIV